MNSSSAVTDHKEEEKAFKEHAKEVKKAEKEEEKLEKKEEKAEKVSRGKLDSYRGMMAKGLCRSTRRLRRRKRSWHTVSPSYNV